MHPAFENLDPPSPLLHLSFLPPTNLPFPHSTPPPPPTCAVLSLNFFHSAYFQSHPHIASRSLILRFARSNMLYAMFEQICIFLFQNDEVRDRRRRGDNEMKQGARQEQGLGQGQGQDPLPPQLSMEHVMPLLQRSVSQSVIHVMPGLAFLAGFTLTSFHPFHSVKRGKK